MKRKTFRFAKKLHAKKLKQLALAITITLAASLIYAYIYQYTEAAKQQRALEQAYEQLQQRNQELQAEKAQSQKQKQEHKKKVEQLNKELDKVEAELQAKRKRQAAIAAAQRAQAEEEREQRSVTITGNKESWLRASGIPESQWWAVDYIVSRESGWNPCAYYPGQNNCNANPSSACGLAQALPCGKVPGHWTDPVANLKWQYSYVTARYGGYPQAVEFWKANHWY